MPTDLQLNGLWDEAARIFPELRREIPAALDKALNQEAQDLRKTIVQQFTNQAPVNGTWAPLARSTILARRIAGFKGSKILIRSSDLRNSVAVTPLGTAHVFVGVNRSAKTSRNVGVMGELVNLGELHEFGKEIKIKVTRKMQRFLFGVLFKTNKGRDAAGRFAGKGKGGGGGTGGFRLGATLTIRIPARPFIGPAIDAMTPEQYTASIAARLATILRGKIGTP